MTIAYLTSQYPAASHTFIRREVAALRSVGLAIRTYSVRPGDTVPQEETFTVLTQPAGAFVKAHFAALAGNPLRYLGTLKLALKHRVPGARAFVWALFHFAEAIVLAARLKRDGATRLHNHFANSAATVGLLAAQHLRLPWSMTLHGISEFDYPAGLLLPAKLERVEFAACASYFVMAQAMRIARPAIWPQLKLIRCGIDPADLPEARSEARTDNELELVCVGRLSPEKGHAGLLVAAGKLLQKGLPIRLTLVGDGPGRASLEALTRDLGIGERVTFTGRLDETATLKAIARSDILVLASFMEGLPVVLMEAMALGVPVIASRVAGIPELVEHGKTGLLFDPANWAQLEHAVERLCRDVQLRGTLAKDGRRRVAEEFSYPDAATPLIALFRGSADD